MTNQKTHAAKIIRVLSGYNGTTPIYRWEVSYRGKKVGNSPTLAGAKEALAMWTKA